MQCYLRMLTDDRRYSFKISIRGHSLQNSNNMYSGNLARILVWRLHFLFLWNNDARKSHAAQQTLNVRNVLSEVFVDPIDLFG